MSYDSSVDTYEHMEKVKQRMDEMLNKLSYRSVTHDASKLESPEKEAFDRATPLLQVPYPSPEYEQGKAALGEALEHHYAHNSHHPEHYENGLDGMSLLDIVEMLADWKAASERTKDGDVHRSLEVNRERFGMSDQLYNIFKNTLEELGW